MLTLLLSAIRRRIRERRRRARLRSLLGKSDRILEDIGLRRSDIEEALGLPYAQSARDHAYRMSARSLASTRQAAYRTASPRRCVAFIPARFACCWSRIYGCSGATRSSGRNY